MNTGKGNMLTIRDHDFECAPAREGGRRFRLRSYRTRREIITQENEKASLASVYVSLPYIPFQHKPMVKLPETGNN